MEDFRELITWLSAKEVVIGKATHKSEVFFYYLILVGFGNIGLNSLEMPYAFVEFTTKFEMEKRIIRLYKYILRIRMIDNLVSCCVITKCLKKLDLPRSHKPH